MLCTLAAFLASLAVPAFAQAEVFIVNTTTDSSGLPEQPVCTGSDAECTLREAIDKANAEEGPDTIRFDEVPAGQHQLLVEEDSLPAIREQVTIEGDTAQGAGAGVPALELVPTNMFSEFTTGFSVQGGTGTRIEGFAIGGFTIGIEVAWPEGGETAETQICGNYLGTDLSGEIAHPNQTGVEVFAFVAGERPEKTEIGGAGCAGNVIAANSAYGVLDSGLESTIAGNSIGIGSQPGGEVLPNGTAGEPGAGILERELASGTTIGGVEPAGERANVIEHNHGPGVRVETNAEAVSIRHDSFSENEGPGIELASGQPPAPTITTARSSSASELEVEGTVTGAAAGETVELDVYGSPVCDQGDAGEGQTFLGTESVVVGSGATPYAFELAVEVPADDTAITATATPESDATSEFSVCATYVPPPQTYVVNTTADSEGGGCDGTCSLREAIELANRSAGRDTIEMGAGAEGTIAIDGSVLPAITEPVEIEGTTAPGYHGAPVVAIDGTEAANEGPTWGLLVDAEDTTIAGLAVENFDEGIVVVANHALVEEDQIAHDTGVGIEVGSEAPETAIRFTTIFDNGGGSIEFETPNSVPEPELESFVPGTGETTFQVPLVGGLADHVYAIDIFAESQCEKPGEHGPAEVLLGSGEITTDSSGEGVAVIHGRALTGIDAEAFTATATEQATGTTSQIGHCTYPPIETEIESTPPPVTSSADATFTFAGFTVGHVEGFECSLDGGAFAACTTPEEYADLGDGSHNFKVRAYNGEGVRDPGPPSYTWTVDTEPPEVSITSAPPSPTNATEATFAFTATDAGSSVSAIECSLDGATFTPCASPQSYGGLSPGSHTFAVRSRDSAGNTSEPTVFRWEVSGPPPQQQQQQTQPAGPPGPEPSNGEKVVVEPTEGKVLVKLPGSKKFVNLEELKEIPVGAIIDATKGKVKLTSIGPDGTEQTASFFAGVFKVKQKEGSDLVVLELLDTNVCPAPEGGSGRAVASSISARAGSGHSGKLWGSGHGNFRTEGNQGSATVRGTIWLVEDRCNGTTFFRTRRGVVTVRDFTTGKTLPLPAGKTYLAGG